MPRIRINRSDAAGFVWGFAEATIFFVVPDILLSWLALRSVKRALTASVWVMTGALLGGTCIWILGRLDAGSGATAFAALPAISEAMITNVREQLVASGPVAILFGPISGTPYKIYALQAGSLGIGIVPFILISIPARLIRFIMVIALVSAVGHLLGRWLDAGMRQTVLAVAWVMFYCWYFYAMAP